MRRLIMTAPGKALCHLVISALLLPFVTLALATRAEAQISVTPSWLVVEFTDANGAISPYGKDAAQKVREEFGNLPNSPYVIESAETTDRYVEELDLATPVVERTSLLRLGQHARATSVVTGEIVDYQVREVAGGKQADVALRLVVVDVASGLSVNGAAVPRASSSVRSSSTDDSVLVNEALAAAANIAVNRIQSNNLPQATLLNTRRDGALINRGTRDGFKPGMEVIILRGRTQVATAIVTDVEPDSADIRITKSNLGIQPGDKARAVFLVEKLDGKLSEKGSPRVTKPGGKSNTTGMVTLAIVLGLVFVMFSGNNSSRNDAARNASVQPTSSIKGFSDGLQANHIKWSLDFFFRSSQNNVQWQVWRNDVVGAPVMVVAGEFTEAYDRLGEGGQIGWANFLGKEGGSTCHTPNLSLTTANRVPPTSGVAYTYKVSLIYKINSLDLPNPTSGGGGGTTGLTGGTTGTTTGGTTGTTGATTGGTTGGTNSGLDAGAPTPAFMGPSSDDLAVSSDAEALIIDALGSPLPAGAIAFQDPGFCFFSTQQTPVVGIATVFDAVRFISPAPEQTITSFPIFQFSSVVNPLNVQQVGYVVQLSSDPLFGNGRVWTSPEVSSSQTTNRAIAIKPRTDGDTFQSFLQDNFGSADTIYWRIGVRNVADTPGPEPDRVTGVRYLFTPAVGQPFKRPIAPPVRAK